MQAGSVTSSGRIESPPESGPPRFLVTQVADALTLAAVVLAPLIKVSFAGGTMSDLLLALALLARLVQFAGPGLDFSEIRRHAFMLIVLGCYALAGFISGIALGGPPSPQHAVVVFATFGSVLVVATYIRDQASITRLVKAYALGSTTLAISSFVMQQRADLGRVIGLSTHPNFLGHSCMIGSFASVYMLERAHGRRNQVFWTAATAVQVIGLMQSGSRGGLLGLVVAGFLYLCFSQNRRYVLGAIAIGYVAVMLLALGAVKLPEGNAITRLASRDVQTQGSNQQREEALQEALAEIKASPVLGKGSTLIVGIHVVYLQAWIGVGVVGAFAIMSLGAMMLLRSITQPPEGLALACGAAAIAIAWIFTNVLGLRDQWLFLAVAMRATASPLTLLDPSHGVRIRLRR